MYKLWAAFFAKIIIHMYRVFSRDILKGGNIGVLAGGRGVLGVYYLLENNNWRGHRFIKILKKPKAIHSPGIFFRGPKKCVAKSNPSESKRKEKLNGTCFSCIVHLSREL